jgi:small subunit ribosomal protein S8
MTDPIADMLTRIRNALLAHKDKVELPASNLKARVAEILRDEGFVSAVTRTEAAPQGTITIALSYGSDSQSTIQEIHRVSRPGQRKYVHVDAIPKIRSGLGIAILSTSRGVMTDRQARKLGVGGELLCEVW